MIIGVTGTQKGGTQRQKEALRQIFLWLQPSGLRHGDCIGVDSESQDIFQVVCKLTGPVYIHPPSDDTYRAKRSGILYHPLPYLCRDEYVAGKIPGAQTDLLVALPEQNYEILRSGTWATVRYARQAKTPVIILLP